METDQNLGYSNGAEYGEYNQGYDDQGAEYDYEEEYQSPYEVQEQLNGVRFSWNEWPCSKVESERSVVPVGCLYTPLKPIPDLPVVQYAPLRCSNSNCKAVLNPFCSVDLRSKVWNCPFCMSRVQFPAHYANNITDTNLPAELMPDYTTIEYEMQESASVSKDVQSPNFVFVVDTAMSMEELNELKDSLTQAVSLLPDEASIGLITFGTLVQVHELIPSSSVPKSFVFRGSKTPSAEKVAHMLGIKYLPQEVRPVNKFIVPVRDCELLLDQIFSDLVPDPWPTKPSERPKRCTGTALSIAVSMAEKICVGKEGTRIVLFVGGPCTLGDGKVADLQLSQMLRSHNDIEKNKAEYVSKAFKFYNSLLERLRDNCHAVDCFASSLDQVGYHEMQNMFFKTGGVSVLADSFGQSVFKESLLRLFDQSEEENGGLKMGLAATCEVVTGSRDVKIRGCIGGCISLNKKSASVSTSELGEGGTYAWRVCALQETSTLAFYFEIQKDGATNQQQQQQSRPYVQFITEYQHSSNGRFRLRVTTVAAQWQQPQSQHPSSSFDQEAAAVLLTRVAVYRSLQNEDVTDILRWLDRALIRLCARFASYEVNQPSTFVLPETLTLFPQFLFHLRRSPFLQKFNSSVDELSYRRLILCRENLSNSLVMIQPSLLSYSFDENAGPPTPVLLDTSSISSNTILLLDTFFHVVVFHGETIASWRDQGYQDLPEHANFKALLSAPREDAQALMEDRFPVPRYIVCDQHKSQSRFILAKLNPSDGGASEGVFTDDVSLKVFMESLMRLSVQE